MNEGIIQIFHCRLTIKQLYPCNYLAKFLSDRNSTISWENPFGFSLGELPLSKDLFIMQKSSDLLCKVQVLTCWVRSGWVKRTHILFHSPRTFLVSGKSASCDLVKKLNFFKTEHLSLRFRCLDLIQKTVYLIKPWGSRRGESASTWIVTRSCRGPCNPKCMQSERVCCDLQEELLPLLEKASFPLIWTHSSAWARLKPYGYD